MASDHPLPGATDSASSFSIHESGWLTPARHCLSPHCDARPGNPTIDLLVIHGISLPPGKFGGPWIEKLFLGELPPAADPYFATIAHLRVSAHLLIRRDGEVVQYVPFTQRAWHAGESAFEGRERCNDFSIGIELEGADEVPYAEPQYLVLARIIQKIMQTYPGITRTRIVGHSDIAPGRKTDPGEYFDWPKLSSLLKLTAR